MLYFINCINNYFWRAKHQNTCDSVWIFIEVPLRFPKGPEYPCCTNSSVAKGYTVYFLRPGDSVQMTITFYVLHFLLQQCVSLVLSLISNSLDAWRTRQYDYYQRVLNGILWSDSLLTKLFDVVGSQWRVIVLALLEVVFRRYQGVSTLKLYHMGLFERNFLCIWSPLFQ